MPPPAGGCLELEELEELDDDSLWLDDCSPEEDGGGVLGVLGGEGGAGFEVCDDVVALGQPASSVHIASTSVSAGRRVMGLPPCVGFFVDSVCIALLYVVPLNRFAVHHVGSVKHAPNPTQQLDSVTVVGFGFLVYWFVGQHLQVFDPARGRDAE